MEMIDNDEINNIKLGYDEKLIKLELNNINNFNDIEALKYELFDIYNMLNSLNEQYCFMKINDELNLERFNIPNERLHTEIIDENIKSSGNKVSLVNKSGTKDHKIRPSIYENNKKENLNKSVCETFPKLNGFEKKENIAKSAVIKGHFRRQSNIVDSSNFGPEIKAFRKLSIKIEENDEDGIEEFKTERTKKNINAGRKISMIDPLVKSHIKKMSMIKNQTSTNVSKKTKITNKKEDSKRNELIKHINKVKLLKPENVFSSKTIHALYLVTNSKITPECIKLRLILSIKEIYNHTNLHQIKQEKYFYLKAKQSILEEAHKEYLKEDGLQDYLDKEFVPSKTSQNCLNYINKEEERKLCRLKNDEEVVNVFKVIYILLNKNIDELPIESLINNIIPKLGIKSLKQLILEKISKSSIDDDVYLKLNELDFDYILDSSRLLNHSRSVSYISHILKELCQYHFMKTKNGITLYKIRNVIEDLKRTKERIQEYVKYS